MGQTLKTGYVSNSSWKESVRDDDPRFRIKTSQQAVSACSGALITSLFMTPLDVVKTRIQAQQKALISNKCFLYCNGLMDHLCPCGPTNGPTNGAAKQPHLNNTLDALVKISRTQGITALWSGLSPTLVLALPATVIYFVTYEKLKVKYTKIYRKYMGATVPMPNYIPLLSGCTARILAVTVVNPLELIRTKMQSEQLNYYQVGKALKSAIGTEGIGALWRGLGSTIYRDVPFSGIYWTSYETIKKYYNVNEPTFAFSFFDGAISGSIAAFLTTPFDVIKTHQQIEFGEKVIYADKPAKHVPAEGTISGLKKIYFSHGIRGLYAGLGPRLAKVAPACAIMIASFEHGKTYFYQYNVRHHLESENVSNKKDD